MQKSSPPHLHGAAANGFHTCRNCGIPYEFPLFTSTDNTGYCDECLSLRHQVENVSLHIGPTEEPIVPHFANCRRCKRRLANVESQRRGYGNYCWKRIGGASSTVKVRKQVSVTLKSGKAVQRTRTVRMAREAVPYVHTLPPADLFFEHRYGSGHVIDAFCHVRIYRKDTPRPIVIITDHPTNMGYSVGTGMKRIVSTLTDIYSLPPGTFFIEHQPDYRAGLLQDDSLAESFNMFAQATGPLGYFYTWTPLKRDEISRLTQQRRMETEESLCTAATK